MIKFKLSQDNKKNKSKLMSLCLDKMKKRNNQRRQSLFAKLKWLNIEKVHEELIRDF